MTPTTGAVGGSCPLSPCLLVTMAAVTENSSIILIHHFIQDPICRKAQETQILDLSPQGPEYTSSVVCVKESVTF